MDSRIIDLIFDGVIDFVSVKRCIESRAVVWEEKFACSLMKWYAKKTDCKPSLDEYDSVNYYQRFFRYLYSAVVIDGVHRDNLKDYLDDHFNEEEMDSDQHGLCTTLKMLRVYDYLVKELGPRPDVSEYDLKDSHKIDVVRFRESAYLEPSFAEQRKEQEEFDKKLGDSEKNLKDLIRSLYPSARDLDVSITFNISD